MVHNPKTHLCFAISLAHLLHPHFHDLQAETFGREIQQKQGLSNQTPVSFNGINTFEMVVGCKIYRNEDNRKSV